MSATDDDQEACDLQVVEVSPAIEEASHTVEIVAASQSDCNSFKFAQFFYYKF